MKYSIVIIVSFSAFITGAAWFKTHLAEVGREAIMADLNKRDHTEAIQATLPQDIKAKLALHEGKALVVNLWATWCKPCLKEIPDLNRLVEEFGDKNVVFLAVSDEKEGDFIEWQVKPVNQDFMFAYTMVWDNEPLSRYLRELDFDSQRPVIPVHYLIDSEGKLKNVLKGSTDKNIQTIREFLEGI